MGMAMKFTPYDEAAETLKYPLDEELYTVYIGPGPAGPAQVAT